MIVPHTFNSENHVYQVEGRYCLSTSDVIELNGLSDMSQIPVATLRHAAYRGTCLHSAIERYEQGEEWQEHFPPEFERFMDAWFTFRDDRSIQIVGPHERRYAYLHEGADVVIGATVDLRFIYQDVLWIADPKSIHPLYGKALQQRMLGFRLQTESYKTATEMDEQFLKPLEGRFTCIKRCVIHLHPNADKRSGKPYKLYEFHQDDSLLWDAAVRIAMEKVRVGILPSKRDVDVREMLVESLEVA